MFETETPTTSCTLCNCFSGQFNVLPVTGMWSCASAVPADRVTLPDCTEITHFSLPVVPEVTTKVRREQNWCFVIQCLDSYQLINLGQAVTTQHRTLQSHTHCEMSLGKQGRTLLKTKTVFSMWQSRHAWFNWFYFPISHSSFSAFLGGNGRLFHHFEIFIAVREGIAIISRIT